MDLSIIVPCHNLEKYITPLINSFNMQQFDYQVEIWFVLDDCTDHTEEVIERKINKEKYTVHIIKCCEHCCGGARNRGLDQAFGDYVWFIDGDDWITDCYAIQTLLHVIIENDYQILKFGYVSDTFKVDLNCMVWQYIYQRALIGNLRFLRIQPNEDVKFSQEIFRKVRNQVWSIPVAFYYYNYGRPGSNMVQLRETGKIVP